MADIDINDNIIIEGDSRYLPDNESGGGGSTADCYQTTDAASSTINDTDYVPMLEGTTKKKTLWSTIIAKIKSVLTKADVGLSNVGNFKAVSTEASQGLSSTEQSNARANIGAGTSSFSGSYNDLSNKPSLATVATSGSYNDLSNKPTIPTNNNQLTNGAGYITSSGSCASATTAGSCTGNAATATKATQDADGKDIRQKYVNIYNSNNIGTSSTVTINDLAKQGSSVAMIYPATDNPKGSAGWVHVLSLAWNKTVNTSWVSQLAMGVEGSNGLWYRTTQGTIVGAAWKRVIDSSNIGSQSVNYATSAGSASSATNSTKLSNYTYDYFLHYPNEVVGSVTMAAFGCVTGSKTYLEISIPMPKSLTLISGATIQALTLKLRTPTGGYVGGSDFNALPYVNSVSKMGGCIRIICVYSSGWYSTNNVCVAGDVVVKMKLS